MYIQYTHVCVHTLSNLVMCEESPEAMGHVSAVLYFKWFSSLFSKPPRSTKPLAPFIVVFDTYYRRG